MVKPIVKDPLFLARKALPAGVEDAPEAIDLLDTLRANRGVCVGMAANMIGGRKNIIAFCVGPGETVMMNPEITRKSGPYETEEGCLSLPGVRKTTRYKRITLRWQDPDGKPRTGSFEGFTAQIIQHEIDHCAGILI